MLTLALLNVITLPEIETTFVPPTIPPPFWGAVTNCPISIPVLFATVTVLAPETPVAEISKDLPILTIRSISPIRDSFLSTRTLRILPAV